MSASASGEIKSPECARSPQQEIPNNKERRQRDDHSDRARHAPAARESDRAATVGDHHAPESHEQDSAVILAGEIDSYRCSARRANAPPFRKPRPAPQARRSHQSCRRKRHQRGHGERPRGRSHTQRRVPGSGSRGRQKSVMVPGLKKLDPVTSHKVHQPVLTRDPT